MIRVVFFLLAVGAFALAAAWLADRPGDVVVTWQGLRIETSLMVLIASDPGGDGGASAHLDLASRGFQLRRLSSAGICIVAVVSAPMRRFRAVSIAVGSGDLAAARRHTAEAKRIAPAEPLALLLSAQSAQLAGDREAADAAFRAMASRADTKSLGLHGLFVEAQRRNDLISAHAFAEEAARDNPSLGWAGRGGARIPLHDR